jgi:hypothetical protein
VESFLEDVVDGFFGVLLRGKIQPLEIARRLTREAEENKIITLNRVYIPNRFTVGLNPVDMASLRAIAPELEAEFERFVGEWAIDRDYTVSGAMKVSLEPRERVARTRMHITAEIDEVPAAAAPSPERPMAHLFPDYAEEDEDAPVEPALHSRQAA